MIKAGLIPILAKKYEEMGIPVSHAESYLLTLIGIGDIYAEGHNNIPGAAIGIPSWERKYANLTLFRIGRLAIEFCTHPIYMPAIFRRKRDGAIKVLCRDGWQLDPNGAMPCSTELPGPEVKTVHLTNGKDWISGVPIDPYGKCDPEKTITLDTTEWLPACSPWDIVGDIHIPGNGSLTPERIRDSLLQATEFARKYLNREVAIFACSSWILNPAWERELPNSNIADFQRQCWRVPADCYDVEGLGFVFGRSDGDRLSYPQKTSLHKAFHRIMASGEKLRSGTIFIFPEHLPFYGTSYYRNNYNEQ